MHTNFHKLFIAYLALARESPKSPVHAGKLVLIQSALIVIKPVEIRPGYLKCSCNFGEGG